MTETTTLIETGLEHYGIEVVHAPQFIQPHGILLVLREPDLQITQISANTETILGVSPHKLLGRFLAEFLTTEQIEPVTQCLDRDFAHVNPLKITFHYNQEQFKFDGIIHRSAQNLLILELEPCISDSLLVDNSFFSFYQVTKGTINKIQRSRSLAELSEVIVNQIQQITGFDRVMVYKFNDDGSGTVIAEVKPEGDPIYLGLRYPKQDVPDGARELFICNQLRMIPVVDHEKVPIIALDPDPDFVLDMSMCVLRGVFGCHRDYMAGMNVSSCLTISLVKDHRLWGLIACHGNVPKYVSYETRTTCEFLGQVMALELATKQNSDHLDYQMRLKSLQADFVDVLSYGDDLLSSLIQYPDKLLALVGATGAAVCSAEQIILLGKTPPKSAIDNLLKWVAEQLTDHLFSTNALPKLYPPAYEYKDQVCGLIALSISKAQQYYILWFRAEVLQEVHWAGDPSPHNLGARADGSLILSPRTSFAKWQETVTNTALPWLECEIQSALELRSSIVGVLFRRVDELSAMNVELERSNDELDAFAYIASHDLKEPLRGIHNYSNFLLEDYASILQADGVSKLESLVRLTQRMEDLINSLLHFSRLGRQELVKSRFDVKPLLADIEDLFNMGQNYPKAKIQVNGEIPLIYGDRNLIEEVFTNLITNGFKYNDHPEPLVEIGYVMPSGNEKPSRGENLTAEYAKQITLYVRDNGIGIREKHLESIFRIFKRLHAGNRYGGGTGAGLTIVKKIVERHGGRVWAESVYGAGTTFYVTLPN
ncbi:MAG: ATP-binding protein [Pseudanabaenaceae cyanobacterium]|jgi:two-component system, chemotaxis family, sensor kinase Cph1